MSVEWGGVSDSPVADERPRVRLHQRSYLVPREFSPYGQKWLFDIMDPPPCSKAVTVEPRQRFSLG
jgi:hypothetical protein